MALIRHRGRLCHFVIDVPELDQAVCFRCAALDATEETISEQSRNIYRRLQLPDSNIRILLLATIDIETDDVGADVRLEALGATRWNLQEERGSGFWYCKIPGRTNFACFRPELVFGDKKQRLSHMLSPPRISRRGRRRLGR